MIDRTRPREERVTELVAAFREQFGRAPEGVAEAPGRVNLIGEHVDYNDGLVLPFAIDRSVMCAWGRRDDDAIWTYSVDFGEHSRFNLGNVTHANGGSWGNYVRGVAEVMRERGLSKGVDVAIAGNVPVGAGLSSSAAIEVAVAGAFRDAFGLDIDDVALAKLCQRAENEFVSVQSGIMDQFASTLSKRAHALLLDCRSLEYRNIPLRLHEHGLAIVIANSSVPRELVSSAYNERRAECEAAVRVLRERLGPRVRSLRDISSEELASVALPEPLDRRARHVVSDIARVAHAVAALGEADFARLGDLMRESHESLRDDYEVSSTELDTLVELATAQEYVLGARLSGAGFGGCTVNIVRGDSVGAFAQDVMAVYRKQTGLPGVAYVTDPGDGLAVWRQDVEG